MSFVKKNSRFVYILITLICIIALFFVVFLFYSMSSKSSEKLEQKSDDINVNYSDKDNPEVKKYIEENAAYQKKITSFDFNQYDQIKSNLANASTQDKCVNGFGGAMEKIQNGIFSEPLYSLDSEKLATDDGGYGYAPFVNAYYVVGDILFKKPMDYFDRKIVTYEQLTRNFSDSRVVIGDQSFKNSYGTMESKFGFPQAYLKQQAGLIVSLSVFNDSCVKSVGLRNIQFDRIDLSGIPITALFSSKYKTSLFHGVNGLYNYTEKSADFVSVNFLDWVQSNNLIYQSLVNDRSKYLFPKGSFLFVPLKYEVKQEIVSVSFKSQPLAVSLDKILTDIAKQNNLNTKDLTYIKEQFKEFTIYKPVKSKNYERVTEFAIAEKEGKLFYATWELPSTNNISGLEPDRSNLVLMNATALNSALGVIKSHYQGEKFDVGTINQNLDLKAVEAESPESVADVKQKREILNKLLTNQNSPQSLSNSGKNLDLEENTIPVESKIYDVLSK